MPTQNVNLSDRHAKFIRRSIADGGYRNASEVVRAGLRILEQQEQEDKLKIRTLRKLSREAFAQVDAGKYIEIEPDQIDAFLDEAVTRVKAQASKK